MGERTKLGELGKQKEAGNQPDFGTFLDDIMRRPPTAPKQVESKIRPPIVSQDTSKGTPQQRSAEPPPPIVRGDNTTPPPKYPGGIREEDVKVIDPIVEKLPLTHTAGATARVAWELFKRTYNDRSNENIKPDHIKLSEIHPRVREQAVRWMLLGDSELLQQRPEFEGKPFRPFAQKNPGHFYAIGFDKAGNPINVIDYYQGNNGDPKYYRQYIFDYVPNEKDGTLRVNISSFYGADQTPEVKNANTISPVGDIFTGRTEYTYNQQARMFTSARLVSNLDNATTVMQVNYARGRDGSIGITQQWIRDRNSGQLKEAANKGQGLNKLFYYERFGY